MNFLKIIALFNLLILTHFISFAQNNKLDAVHIAKEYSNSIVKVLLYDSIAEKKTPGTGYLGRGSGFIVSKDGLIFTNRHVIDYCMEYMEYSYFSPSDRKIYKETNKFKPKYLNDPDILSINYIRRAVPIVQVYYGQYENEYKLYRAKLIAVDTKNFDGAILKIVSDLDGNPVSEIFKPIPIGNSDQTNQGEDMCVYGFPAQYENSDFDLMLKDQSTLTFGKHSGFDYVFNPYYGYIKTDAAVNSGNSGGPVFNSSNKVIGIATASGNKTNIGLVGGINAMYNLSSIQKKLYERYRAIYFTQYGIWLSEDKIAKGRLSMLLDELIEIGFTQPARIPNNFTTLLFSNQPIPSEKQIKSSNRAKKNIRSFYGCKDYFKLLISTSQNDNFSLDDIDVLTNNNFDFNIIKDYKVINTGETNFEFGHLFTIKRFNPISKLYFDWSASIGYGSRDWTGVDIYSDKYNSTILYKDDANYFRFGQRLGITYSFLFLYKFPLDAYYKLSSAYEVSGNFGTLSNNQYNYDWIDTQELNYSGATTYNSIGLNFRKSFFFIGFEYSFGKTSLEYELPYVNSWPYFDGTNTTQRYSIEKIKADGKNNFNSFSITLGFMFGGNNRWKKKAIKEYNSK